MSKKESLEDRFWKKVDRCGPDECWEWTAYRDVQGYGHINVNGKMVRAHCFSRELHYGPIPEGMWVFHKCGNPFCVNPKHLFLGPRGNGKTAKERFWEKVDKGEPDECWEWVGTKNPKGYGHIEINGKEVRAHRFSWEIHNGPIPEGLCVLHKCDNPGCVNPAHLFLGTYADNAQDMIAKGRDNKARGEASGNAKLTEQDVREIHALLKCCYLSRQTIGEMFGVTRAAVGAIKTGKNWGWLDISEEDNKNGVDEG